MAVPVSMDISALWLTDMQLLDVVLEVGQRYSQHFTLESNHVAKITIETAICCVAEIKCRERLPIKMQTKHQHGGYESARFPRLACDLTSSKPLEIDIILGLSLSQVEISYLQITGTMVSRMIPYGCFEKQ